MSTQPKLAANNFAELLADLDLSLFEKIHSQTTPNDKKSLLAVQNAVGELLPSFTYLEIGSYVGGSLQPYLLDPKCEKIFSIDKRPVAAADERGIEQIYSNNTTAYMLNNLRLVSEEAIAKITTIDGDVSEIDKTAITSKPQLCFIDGEHTDAATWRDFEFCLDVMTENGAIIFHDAMIIYNCLARVVEHLKENGHKVRAYNLPDVVFVVEIGDFPLHRSKAISEMLFDNHIGYLSSLRFTDQYRQFANRPLFRFARNLKLKLTKANVTK